MNSGCWRSSHILVYFKVSDRFLIRCRYTIWWNITCLVGELSLYSKNDEMDEEKSIINSLNRILDRRNIKHLDYYNYWYNQPIFSIAVSMVTFLVAMSLLAWKVSFTGWIYFQRDQYCQTPDELKHDSCQTVSMLSNRTSTQQKYQPCYVPWKLNWGGAVYPNFDVLRFISFNSEDKVKYW